MAWHAEGRARGRDQQDSAAAASKIKIPSVLQLLCLFAEPERQRDGEVEFGTQHRAAVQGTVGQKRRWRCIDGQVDVRLAALGGQDAT